MRRVHAAWILVLTMAALAAPALAQDPKEMEAMMKAGTPGEQHKRLGALAGSWTVHGKFWQPGGGGTPAEMTGSAEVKPIMDGRYVHEEFSGDFMGMPFRGVGVTGYDNVRQKYLSTWIDNMGTTIMLMTGTYDGATKTYTYTGQYPDPMTGREKPMKIVMKVVDDNKHVSEFFDHTPGDKWVKTMELTYTRK
jgi:hypothetical protein